MSYYQNVHLRMDGNIILYQRDLSTAAPKSKSHRKPNWYMKLRLGPKKVVNRSTKLTDYDDAYAYAKDQFLKGSQAIKMGHSLEDMSFEQHWDSWYQRNLANGTWKLDRQRWHQNYAKRYFKPYFRRADGSSTSLNEITSALANGYWDWRIAYWSTGPGRLRLEYNPKRRGAKTRSTHNAKAVPSKKTLAMEQSALNQIFQNARELGRLPQEFKLKAPRSQRPPNRRPHFEKQEKWLLVRNLRSYRDCVGPFKHDRANSWHKVQRTQFNHFVIFMLNSGLRVGEAREMRWRDIQFDQSVDGLDQSIAVVSVRKDTKTGKARDVQTQPSGNQTLKEWKAITQFSGPNDLVWFGQSKVGGNQKPLGDLNKSFQAYLKRVPVDGQPKGLLLNKEGETRTLYSLRHTYATTRREQNVSMDDLALNMGCTRVQLELHYCHSTSNTRRSDIVKFRGMKARDVKDARGVDQGAPIDPFVDEAFKRYNAGLMDQATLLKIVTAGT